MIITEKNLDYFNRLYYDTHPELAAPVHIETEEEPEIPKLCKNCGAVTTSAGSDCLECEDLRRDHEAQKYQHEAAETRAISSSPFMR